MTTTRKALTTELEATTQSLQHQVADLQKNLTKLQQMTSNSSDEAFNPYQYAVWTQGAAARTVAEIGSLLSRQQTLKEALHLLEG
jgi:hypothetical protein